MTLAAVANDTDRQISQCSLRAQIAALAVGESVALPRRLALASTDEKAVSDALEALRNTAQPAAHRAKAQTGATYTIETGDFMTRDRALMLVVVVTRTA